MMYITAQRVVSPVDKNRSGINCFHYRKTGDLPRFDDRRVDILTAFDDAQLELIDDRVQVAPGGNVVESFIDVVADPSLPSTTLREHLEVVGENLGSEFPAVLGTDEIGVRFNLIHRLASQAAVEFRALTDAIVDLLERPTGGWRDAPPLDVEVRTTADGVRYSLTETSVDRVKKKQGPQWIPAAITIEHSTLADLESTAGPLLPHLAQLLTGLSAEDVLGMGGIQIIDEGNRIVGSWPMRQPPERARSR